MISLSEGESIKLIGKVAAKVAEQRLSRELWRPLSDYATSWELIYFIANPRELDVPFSEFCCSSDTRRFSLRALRRSLPNDSKVLRSGDLYSILVKIQKGQPIAKKVIGYRTAADMAAPALGRDEPVKFTKFPKGPVISEHIRMQWKLARLGIKAGERVWVRWRSQARQTQQFESFGRRVLGRNHLPYLY